MVAKVPRLGRVTANTRLDDAIVTSYKTPWTTHVTRTPELFGFAQQGTQLVVTAGVQKGTCRMVTTRKTVRQQTASGAKVASVVTYFLELPRWKHASPPLLRAHPFLVPHLLASGQVDARELRDRALEIGQGVRRVTIAITKPCPMLTMLGVDRCPLTFSTNFNITLDKAG